MPHVKTTEPDLSGSLRCHLGNTDRQRREENQTVRHSCSSGGYSEEKYFYNSLKFYILSGLRGLYTYIFPSIGIKKKEKRKKKGTSGLHQWCFTKSIVPLWICRCTARRSTRHKSERKDGAFYCCFSPFASPFASSPLKRQVHTVYCNQLAKNWNLYFSKPQRFKIC